MYNKKEEKNIVRPRLGDYRIDEIAEALAIL